MNSSELLFALSSALSTAFIASSTESLAFITPHTAKPMLPTMAIVTNMPTNEKPKKKSKMEPKKPSRSFFFFGPPAGVP